MQHLNDIYMEEDLLLYHIQQQAFQALPDHPLTSRVKIQEDFHLSFHLLSLSSEMQSSSLKLFLSRYSTIGLTTSPAPRIKTFFIFIDFLRYPAKI